MLKKFFNKKVLLWFYGVGVPIVVVWAYLITRVLPKRNMQTIYDVVHAENVHDQLYLVIGAGIVWISMAYGIFMIFKIIRDATKQK